MSNEELYTINLVIRFERENVEHAEMQLLEFPLGKDSSRPRAVARVGVRACVSGTKCKVISLRRANRVNFATHRLNAAAGGVVAATAYRSSRFTSIDPTVTFRLCAPIEIGRSSDARNRLSKGHRSVPPSTPPFASRSPLPPLVYLRLFFQLIPSAATEGLATQRTGA